MRIAENSYDQTGSCQNNHEHLICTHKYHPSLQDSEWAEARPPAARVSILCCQGAVVDLAPLRHRNSFWAVLLFGLTNLLI